MSSSDSLPENELPACLGWDGFSLPGKGLFTFDVKLTEFPLSGELPRRIMTVGEFPKWSA